MQLWEPGTRAGFFSREKYQCSPHTDLQKGSCQDHPGASAEATEGVKVTKLAACHLCSMYRMKELPRQPVPGQSCVSYQAFLVHQCFSYSGTSQESCLLRDLGPAACVATAGFLDPGFKYLPSPRKSLCHLCDLFTEEKRNSDLCLKEVASEAQRCLILVVPLNLPLLV